MYCRLAVLIAAFSGVPSLRKETLIVQYLLQSCGSVFRLLSYSMYYRAADPDSVDPDPDTDLHLVRYFTWIRIQILGVDDQNWRKKIQLKIFCIFFWSKFEIHLCLSYRRSNQPSKKNIQRFQKWILWTFLCLWVIFALLEPDPNCDSGTGYGSRDPIESGFVSVYGSVSWNATLVRNHVYYTLRWEAMFPTPTSCLWATLWIEDSTASRRSFSSSHSRFLFYVFTHSSNPRQRVYAQTSFYQENLAFCFQPCTLHSHEFRWFSVASLVFLFFGFLTLQLNQIWWIFCAMYGEEGWWTLFVCLQKPISHWHVWMSSLLHSTLIIFK